MADAGFDRRKASTLSSLGGAGNDKSPKGTIDAPIISLLEAINRHPDYFTTSSCSGRISVFSHPTASPAEDAKKKARGGTWLFLSHDPVADAEEVVSLLFPPRDRTECDLVLRFEPLIVAVECRDVESAQRLVSIAISCGFRESGITSVGVKRVIVAIRCSIRMEVPLGRSSKVVVTEDYVRYLVSVANEKMEANRKRTDGLLEALMRSLPCGGEAKGESGCASGLDNGATAVDDLSLFITPLKIVGEPFEKLFLWAHSACVVNDECHGKILLFGGFGGMGRHARRNDSYFLDPSSGTLEAIAVGRSPSPRMGHIASVVGENMFVIGGREDPTTILNDVWVFSVANRTWTLVNCKGDYFPPRHRHAAAVVGSKIFVFGGVNGGSTYASLFVFDTVNLLWKELSTSGTLPCGRHSHSMIAFESRIFMFGGHSGEMVLGDLYSFDIQNHIWKRLKTFGISSYARFSHSMFIYRHYLGIIGGCPVKQRLQELSLLDLQLHCWRHVALCSAGKDLLVRATVNVIGNDLVVVGGGASCYAFGTKFSVTMKISLLPLCRLDNTIAPPVDEHFGNHNNLVVDGNDIGHGLRLAGAPIAFQNTELEPMEDGHAIAVPPSGSSSWAIKVGKRHAKLVKDILKKFGWLDLVRKAYSNKDDGMFICFPVTETFCDLLHDFEDIIAEFSNGLSIGDSVDISVEQSTSLDELTDVTALNILKQCGVVKLVDNVVAIKNSKKTPAAALKEEVEVLLRQRGLPEEYVDQIPTRWERLGDIVVLPATSFTDPSWDTIGEELWSRIAQVLGCRRLARQGFVASTGTRDSKLKMLLGDNGWVDHRENGILYSFDATRCMFSWGNLSEKLRMASLDCQDEVVVDLFAGIGYFTLPFLVRAKAKLVYACEWNPHAVEALRRNIQNNSVSDRCIILEGDNRICAPEGLADRVCLGLLPSSEGSWATAIKALRKDGGVLHVHGNVKDLEETSWIEHVTTSIDAIARSEGLYWDVRVEHVERVKWYAPHIRHLVADVTCRHTQR
ncbi:hypothetical protein MLD38_036848 [Melastoma candidum]|uniref:Uncharacterized protein n=1 Tax=Melastoma candidum TaxID=119954 RepID=A0ACB9LLM9_9MYRT|nr:hypothetical protein MLD38_036848 [Melastoma candidum]